MEETKTLVTSNLTIGYPPNKVLFTDLNLHLPQGKLVCFMGPNGIGKSTLIRTLAGIQQPLSGTIDGLGSKNIAVVLTDKINAGAMTVEDLLTFGRYPYLNWTITLTESDREKVREAINNVRIEYLLGRPVHELSDGQVQMVMIARALAQDTPVMLLDEPTAHLDLNNRVEIMNLLRGLAKENNKSILVSTHELDLALQTADLIWIASHQSIKTGIPEDLVLDGTFDEVFQFKGFDLKTGKIEHKPFRDKAIKVTGDGPTYLWTRNALERNGYKIQETSENTLLVKDGKPGWTLATPQQTRDCKTLEEVLSLLEA